MANRALTDSELNEYYLIAAAYILSKMNRGIDVTMILGEEVTQLLRLSIWRSRVKNLNAATLEVDDETLIPTAATITALT